MATMTATRPEYLCVNGYKHQAIPLHIASEVVSDWCDKNPMSSLPREKNNFAVNTHPSAILSELSGVNRRLMFSIYKNSPRKSGYGRKQLSIQSTIGIEVMDRIITLGMGEPERWHQPPLDLYYLPIDEWTDEMRARHAAL